MDVKASKYRGAESAVMNILQKDGPQDSAPNMVSRLRESGHSEEMVRTAIWRLIDRDEIELTTDRKLRTRVE